MIGIGLIKTKNKTETALTGEQGKRDQVEDVDTDGGECHVITLISA